MKHDTKDTLDRLHGKYAIARRLGKRKLMARLEREMLAEMLKQLKRENRQDKRRAA